MYYTYWSIVGFVSLIVIINKLWCFWCRSKVCLIGKTAVITGGFSGLGYQTALALASRGCRVIIGDTEDLSETVVNIIKQTHNPNVVGKKLNLASFRSVREFAKEILAEEARLDILINNAGIGQYDIIYTEDGLQRTMQINYFGHFLLTHLLMDLLKKSAPSRIVFTSSMLAHLARLKLENLNPKPDFYNIKQNLLGGSYSLSKLTQIVATQSFADKLKGTGITCNAVLPMGVSTPIVTKAFRILMIFVYIFGKNAEEGAQTLLHVCIADEVKDITGECFYEGNVSFKPYQARDMKFCQEVWDLTLKYCKLEPHEIKC